MTIQSKFNPQPVKGIAGYHEVSNKVFQPNFRLSLPENWQFSYTPIPKEKTNWIALSGPWDEEAQRFASLHIMLKEGWHTEKNLDESADHSIADKMIGEHKVLFIRPAAVSGREAREIGTTCKSMNPYTFHFRQDKHQWVIFREGNFAVTIHYSASEKEFEKYFEVYTKAVESFTLLS